LGSAFAPFGRVGFLVIESDSSDSTLNELEKLSQNIADFKYKSLGNLADKIPNRVDRITYCRNAYLEEIEGNRDFADFDYIAVADLDGVNKDLTQEAVRSCFIRSDWDACAANQSAPYYDIYALRHPSWSPNDCWIFEKELRQAGMNPVAAREKAVYSRQIVIPADADWIEVESAFGGLCIYKRSALVGCVYRSYTNDGTPVCEHVEFHLQIRDLGGTIYINPKLINSGWNIHSSSKRLHKYIKRRIKFILWFTLPSYRRRGF
jgi:hypothetical protein